MFRPVFRTAVLAGMLAIPAMTLLADDDGGRHTLASVMYEVLSRHPELAVAGFDAAIAGTELARIESRLDPAFTARVSASDDRTPVLSEFQPAETLTGAVTGTLSQPLAGGGTLSATAEYARTRQRFTSPFASQLALINPAYRGGLSVSYRHPLLRGDGRPEVHDALLAAGAERDALELQRLLLARLLGLQALNASFSLMADDIGIRMAEVGVDRAVRLLEFQQFRQDFGLIESADRIQVEALVALRRLELQRALAQRQLNVVELNRLMLRDPAGSLTIASPARSVPARAPSIEDGVIVARAQRPEFRLIERQLEAEEARMRLARDAGRPQLDLVAELGIFALERNPIDAAHPDHHDRYAGIALELSDILGRRAAKAELLRSELAAGRLRAQAHQSTEQVRDELARIHATLVTGDEILRLQRQRAEAERRKFEAELDRYRDGRSDTATLIQFEGELHQAELEAELQELTLGLAGWQFAWSTGTLFEELGIDIEAVIGVAR